jgi:hypothetical protein
MPEFILDRGSHEASKRFEALDEFTQGYIEAMFFTETGYPENEELEHASFGEMAPETVARCVADCAAFCTANQADLNEAYDQNKISYGAMQAGRDYWFTRNGHGVGYWDRGLGAIGDKILLSTGGPALRIWGTLTRGEPDECELQMQDWGTPWAKWAPEPYDPEYRDTLRAYASCFYFEE